MEALLNYLPCLGLCVADPDVGKGQHEIHIDHSTMGQTCGILPVGIDSAHVRTKGLKWDVGELSLHSASLTLSGLY